jgi:hypothetical protein
MVSSAHTFLTAVPNLFVDLALYLFEEPYPEVVISHGKLIYMKKGCSLSQQQLGPILSIPTRPSPKIRFDRIEEALDDFSKISKP